MYAENTPNRAHSPFVPFVFLLLRNRRHLIRGAIMTCRRSGGSKLERQGWRTAFGPVLLFGSGRGGREEGREQEARGLLGKLIVVYN